MKKRGPKTLLTKKLQDAICKILANANTIQTACAACGIGEKTYFRWCEKHPTFLTATREARARAKMQLVDIIRTAALKNAFHAQWILERSWPNEYARTERIEQIGEKADEKIGCRIFYDTGGQKLAELLSFPIDPSMNQTEVAPAPEISDAPPPTETISDAPPPKVVPKPLTGRIRPSWKGNGK